MTEELDKFNSYLKRKYSPSTQKQYREAFINYRDDVLDTQDNLNEFIANKRLDSKGNPRRLNPFYSGFLKAYNGCFDVSLLIEKDERKFSSVEKEYEFLTEQDIKTMIDKAKPRISLLIQIYWETGLRRTELIKVELNNIDVIERTIKGIGKNNRQFKVRISSNAAAKIEQYLKNNNQEYPFYDRASSAKDQSKKFYEDLKKLGKEISMGNLHPHRIRHALGRHLRLKGWDLQQIRKVLRHSKLDTTSIYTTATSKEIDDKLDKEMFGEGNDT